MNMAMISIKFNPSKIVDLGDKAIDNIRKYFSLKFFEIIVFFPLFIIGSIFCFLFWLFFLFIYPQIDTDLCDSTTLDKIPIGLAITLKIIFFLPSYMASLFAIPICYIVGYLQLLFMLPVSAIFNKRIVSPIVKKVVDDYMQTEECKKIISEAVGVIINNEQDEFDTTDDNELFGLNNKTK